ncbi:hypothetical protein [Opitutus terrae]|uniref:Uncharacterized protein n=1 Tax=Opitutus terrae (strain DSM 11246 / JCM 15787 / PB90-1) TaxID=452637 RepID=B1ZMK2_OPITP|nr:hypothetical protein [Opitutus terrae]ACB74347.1 hypothetical protein Oter_1059 [Opitutus terrae PB90-1]
MSLLTRRFSCWLLIGIVLGSGWLAPAGRAAEDTRTAATPETDFGAVVVLSPYEVVAQSLDFRRWRRYSSPHFLVYTDADPNLAAMAVRQMEMVQQTAEFYFRRKITRLAPMIAVLPTRAEDWRRIGAESDAEWDMQGVMIGSCRKLQLIQNDWQKKDLSPAWRGLVAYQLETIGVAGPPWFKRGIEAFFSAVNIRGDTLTMGRQREWRKTLARHGWIEWPRFFGLSGAAAEGPGALPRGQFSAQAAVIMHYCLSHPAPGWTPRLFAWASYLAAGGVPSEENFQRFFEIGWADWQQRLERMLDDRKYTEATVRFMPASLRFPVASNDVSTAEMRELFVLSQIATRPTKESDASLDALLAHGLATESLRELLADACGARGRTDAQFEELRRLIALGSENPAVYADAAQILFQRERTDDTLDARLGGEDGEQIRDWCRKAVALEPLYLKAAELLAWAEAIAPTVDARSLAAITNLHRALDQYTRTDKILVALAVAQWRVGNGAEAHALAEQIRASELSGSWAKQLAADLLARLDATSIRSTTDGG